MEHSPDDPVQDCLGPTIGDLTGIELEPAPPFDPATTPPGNLDRRVLDQTEIWVDRFGDVHRLSDMSDIYRANVVAHLHVCCEWMWTVASFEEIVTTPVVVHAANRDAGVPLIGDVDPHAWLESTPLVRALRRLSPDIADPASLVDWASRLNELTPNGYEVADDLPELRMPQDPDRSWTRDMNQIPPVAQD